MALGTGTLNRVSELVGETLPATAKTETTKKSVKHEIKKNSFGHGTPTSYFTAKWSG